MIEVEPPVASVACPRAARSLCSWSAAIGVAACGTDAGVTTERADEIGINLPPASDPDDPTVTSPSTPPNSDPGTSTPPLSTTPADPAAINFGPNKPGRAYDDFLLAVITDLHAWWTEQFPAYYGEAFTPLDGDVYAAYPGRPDDIPGCGTDRTSYEEVQQYVAFYCGVGDFMVYDDGDDGLLAELARDYGAATIGTVFAHEFGHAIQLRSGALDRALPTILTEQQSDCFAGAWTSRVANGESPLVGFTDEDVRSGLIAMTKVSDPVGLDQFVPGGAWLGVRSGGSVPGRLRGGSRSVRAAPRRPVATGAQPVQRRRELTPGGGDATFGYGEDELLGFLPSDLNKYWDEELAAEIPGLDPIALRVVHSDDDLACDDVRGDIRQGSAYCVSTNEVLFNETVALDLYRTLGDFSVGYLISNAWSEAVQEAMQTDLDGEQRALLDDCLTGGWIKTVIPVNGALPLPRLETPHGDRLRR